MGKAKKASRVNYIFAISNLSISRMLVVYQTKAFTVIVMIFLTTAQCPHMQCESKKSPPAVF